MEPYLGVLAGETVRARSMSVKFHFLGLGWVPLVLDDHLLYGQVEDQLSAFICWRCTAMRSDGSVF